MEQGIVCFALTSMMGTILLLALHIGASIGRQVNGTVDGDIGAQESRRPMP